VLDVIRPTPLDGPDTPRTSKVSATPQWSRAARERELSGLRPYWSAVACPLD
jgi:hypothetical protein